MGFDAVLSKVRQGIEVNSISKKINPNIKIDGCKLTKIDALNENQFYAFADKHFSLIQKKLKTPIIWESEEELLKKERYVIESESDKMSLTQLLKRLGFDKK